MNGQWDDPTFTNRPRQERLRGRRSLRASCGGLMLSSDRARPRSCAPWRLLCLLLGLQLLAPLEVSAQQSADDILASVVARQDAEAASIENYTVIETIDGDRQVHYFERRMNDGHASFAPVGPFALLAEAGGLGAGALLGTLKQRLAGAATSAGMGALHDQLDGMGDGVFAEFIGPLLTPEPGQPPGESLGSLTSADHLKSALLQGARRAALHQLERTLLDAAAPQLGALLDGIRSSGGAGELLGRLGDQVVSGQLPTPGSVFGGMGPASADGSAMGMRGLGGAINGATAALGAAMAARTIKSAGAIAKASGVPSLDLEFADIVGQVAGHARIDGAESIDGHGCWVIRVTDASVLPVPAQGTFRSPELTLWIDRKLLVARRMRLTGETKVDGDWRPMTMETEHGDFTATDGLLLPHHTRTTLSSGTSSATEAEQDQWQEKMAEMQKSLAKLPPERRAMVERMIQSRMPQLESMMGGLSTPVETTVKEVHVNRGPPGELVEAAHALGQRPPG